MCYKTFKSLYTIILIDIMTKMFCESMRRLNPEILSREGCKAGKVIDADAENFMIERVEYA